MTHLNAFEPLTLALRKDLEAHVKKAAALFALLSSTALAAFTGDFKAKVNLYFSTSVVATINTASTPSSGEGSVIFKNDPDYFGTGDKINKVMAIESARLFREVPGLTRLKFTIPNAGKTYSLNITRVQIEKHYGVKLAGMSLDIWRTKITNRFDSPAARAAFAKKFVVVK